MSDRFAGKTAVVTGAGSGIGLATAKKFIEGGAKVIAVDVAKERLEEAAKEIGEAYVPLVYDISKEDVGDVVLAAADGKVDILVNNAGIMDGFIPVAEMDDEHWFKVLDINLTAPMRLVRAILPTMSVRGGGAIVNVSSEASLRATASGLAYSVSKNGINALTKHVAIMYRDQGIRCNAIAPGGVKTNVSGAFLSGLAERVLMPIMGVTQNVDHLAEPEQLASVICFLCDESDSSNVNGAIIPVDGGWSAV